MWHKGYLKTEAKFSGSLCLWENWDETTNYFLFSLSGLLLLSEPVAALLIDYFLLDKPINGWQWVGAALTLAAIYLGSLKKNSA